jgi:hypothetical protein
VTTTKRAERKRQSLIVTETPDFGELHFHIVTARYGAYPSKFRLVDFDAHTGLTLPGAYEEFSPSVMVLMLLFRFFELASRPE